MAKDVQQGKGTGFYDYLTKPLDFNCLLKVEDEILVPAKQ
jgi:hypothetical protein